MGSDLKLGAGWVLATIVTLGLVAAVAMKIGPLRKLAGVLTHTVACR